MTDEPTPDEPVGAATEPLAQSRLADAVSIASDFGLAWVLLAVLQVATRRSSPREAAGRLAAAGIGSLVLTRLLKHRFAAPRRARHAPTHARTPTSTRFPSGHTLAAFTAALVVPRTGRGRALALGFAALVGWARVRVGHHEPQDVLAGAAVGALAGGALAGALAVTSPSR